MTPYSFDTLPVHPQPAPLESLSSYLTRLAEANGFYRIENLFRLCFPTGRSRLTFQTGDFPPPSFGGLPSLAHCPEPDLRATTFYHLGRKFDRILSVQSLAQCLAGSLGLQLRYCPLCLSEYGYYSLLWRFLSLMGCPEHRCYLLDHCGHCGQAIPLLASLPRLGSCPACGGDLRQAQAKQIAPDRLDRVSRRSQDLTYLLQPQPGEMSQERLTRLIGQRFSRWRQVRQLKVKDIGEMLETAEASIYHLERGSEQRGVKFQWYLEYADRLAVSLRDIFETPAPELAPQTSQEKQILKIRQAVAILKQQQQSITRRAIVDLIGSDHWGRSPEVRAVWTEIREQERVRYEQKLLDLVQQAIEQLQQQGQTVSDIAVARLVGHSSNGLKKNYPTVRDLLSQHTAASALSRHSYVSFARPKYQREPELLIRVQEAITALGRVGQPLSHRAIAKRVGLAPATLKAYPRIRLFLQVYKGQQKRRDETLLLGQVQRALAHLEEAGEVLVTLKAVGKVVGVSVASLHSYPQVSAFLTEHITNKQEEHHARHRQRREADLLQKVKQAIETLQVSEGGFTQRILCEQVGMSSAGLKSYPKVKQLLAQLLLDPSVQLLSE